MSLYIRLIFYENNCRAYDRAAIKFRGLDADINFQVADYEDEIKHVSDQNKNVLALLAYIHTSILHAHNKHVPVMHARIYLLVYFFGLIAYILLSDGQSQ